MLKHTWSFFVSTSAAVIASIFVLAASALWTALIKRAGDVNTWTVRPAQVPLGIEVSTGVGLYLTWAAFACLATSIIPYSLRSVPLFHLILAIPRALIRSHCPVASRSEDDASSPVVLPHASHEFLCEKIFTYELTNKLL